MKHGSPKTFSIWQDFFRNETYKSLGIPDLTTYTSVAWVGHFRSKDPNDLLLQLHSWQTSDISNGGSVKETLAKLKSRCLIMPCGESTRIQLALVGI